MSVAVQTYDAGTPISVYWSLDKVWYDANVLRFDPLKSTMLVKYTVDRVEEWLNVGEAIVDRRCRAASLSSTTAISNTPNQNDRPECGEFNCHNLAAKKYYYTQPRNKKSSAIRQSATTRTMPTKSWKGGWRDRCLLLDKCGATVLTHCPHVEYCDFKTMFGQGALTTHLKAHTGKYTTCEHCGFKSDLASAFSPHSQKRHICDALAAIVQAEKTAAQLAAEQQKKKEETMYTLQW